MNIRANAYYRLNGASAGAPSNPASELLAALAGSIQGVTGGKFGMQQVQSSGVLSPGIRDLLQRQTDQYVGSNRPKAFLNWVLLDEQFKIVNTSTGFEPVGADGEFKTFVKTGLPISLPRKVFRHRRRLCASELNSISIYKIFIFHA
jgi:hypothetical protein